MQILQTIIKKPQVTTNVKLESRKTEIVFSSKRTPLIGFIYSFKLLLFLFFLQCSKTILILKVGLIRNGIY